MLIYITMFVIKIYTHHGKTMQVPDFYGLTESEVQNEVKVKKLRYSIIDSVFIPDAIPGTVIGQHPEVGYNVKQRRTIYLTISAISPEKVLLPEVVDWSLREARSRLENAGLKLGAVEYRPSEFMNLVLEKSINGIELPDDTMLIKGTAVDLVVGKGLSNEMTQVPDLKGVQIDEALDMLYAVGLNIGVTVYDNSFETEEDSLEAVVWKQDPIFSDSKLLERGSSVDIWLTVDQEKIDIVTEKEF